MDNKAITKSESRLRVARKALEGLRACQDYNNFVDLLYTYVTATKNIWTALEQGVKDSAQCRQWFGGKKNARKQDELMQYLFEARNDDEHGLEPITELHPGSLGIGVAKPGYSNSILFNSVTMKDGQVTVDAQSLDGKPILIEQTAPHARLADVRARGRVISPPKSHLGQPLADTSPLAVAELGYIYLERLLDEARTRCS